MKRFSTLLGLILFVILFSTTELQAKRRTTDTNGDGKLRVLAIGNSFSDDAMEYLPSFVDNLECEHFELARLYIGGCSLERHVREYRQGNASYQFYHYDYDAYEPESDKIHEWKKDSELRTMEYVLKMGEWDIITMQQASHDSGQYESYQPHLQRLIDVVKQAQPQARLAWHMTWSYSTNSTHGSFPRYDKDQMKMYNAICNCVEQLKADADEIDIIIPSGSMIQSLRASAVNNTPFDLTRDGYHMGHGIGRYAVACLWYEALVKPYTNRSMKGNTLRVSKGLVAVSDIVAAYCQIAAETAVRKPMEIFPIKGAEKLASKFSDDIDIIQ